MLRLKDMYDIYKKYYSNKQTKAEQELTKIVTARKELKANIILHESVFKESNITLSTALSITDSRTIKAISFTGKVSLTTVDILTQHLKDISYLNKRLKALVEEINSYKHIVVEYEVFKEILQLYNKTKVNLLITKGYSWNLGSGLGTISVVLKKIPVKKDLAGNVMIRPNWPASKKNKRELEKQGVSLYSEDNPTGVKWIVAHTDETQAYFDWRGANPLFIANVKI